MTKLAIEHWPMERLTPYARDLTKQDAATVERMAELIRLYGMRLPLLVDSDGGVIDGNLRLKAIATLAPKEVERLGLSTLPVISTDDLTPEEVRALRLALKRSASWAPWDEVQLAVELQELTEAGISCELTAFDQEELDKLLASLDLGEESGAAPPAKSPKDDKLVECPKCGFRWQR